MSSTHILIYKITGRQLFFSVPSRVCEECDLTVNLARKIISDIGSDEITLEVKPWLNKAISSILKGGWHPPVLLINGRVFSQGVVPNAKDLERKIRKELARQSPEAETG